MAKGRKPAAKPGLDFPDFLWRQRKKTPALA